MARTYSCKPVSQPLVLRLLHDNATAYYGKRTSRRAVRHVLTTLAKMQRNGDAVNVRPGRFVVWDGYNRQFFYCRGNVR